MEKEILNVDLQQEEIFEDSNSLVETIWNTVETAYNDFKLSQATISVDDKEIVLSYSLNNEVKFISFSCDKLDKKKAVELILKSADKSRIKGKLFCKKTLIELVFHH